MRTSRLLSNSGCLLLPADSQMFPSFLSAHSLIVLPSTCYQRHEKENDVVLVLLYNWYIVAVYPYSDLNLMFFWWLKPKGFAQSSAKEASSCTPYPSMLRQSSVFVDYTRTLGGHPSPSLATMNIPWSKHALMDSYPWHKCNDIGEILTCYW